MLHARHLLQAGHVLDAARIGTAAVARWQYEGAATKETTERHWEDRPPPWLYHQGQAMFPTRLKHIFLEITRFQSRRGPN